MYIELHSRSAFSFLEGASAPEQLIATGSELQMPAMALLDRDGLYGAARFHLAAKSAKIKAHIGAEVTCQVFSPPRHEGTEKTFSNNCSSDRPLNRKAGKRANSSEFPCLGGEYRLPLLVASRTGYQNLCRLLTRIKLRAKKDEGAVFENELQEHAAGLICLTGDENGPLAKALGSGGMDEGRE